MLSEAVPQAFVFYGAMLILKMLAMGPATIFFRFKNKAFMNQEDIARGNRKIKFNDPDVERIRRAHQNDVENIPAFLLVGWFYILTSPSPAIAVNLFRLFTAARFVHTFVYAVVVVPQPTRFLSYLIGLLVTAYMAAAVMLTAYLHV